MILLKTICHKTFQRYMLICRNAEGVHDQRKVGYPLRYQKEIGCFTTKHAYRSNAYDKN